MTLESVRERFQVSEEAAREGGRRGERMRWYSRPERDSGSRRTAGGDTH